MSFSRSIIAAACVTLPTTVTAQELMHCYVGEAPDDAPISSTQNLSPMLDALQVAFVRHACGQSTADDIAMFERIIAAGGCSPDSEASKFALETFDFSQEETLGALKQDAGDDAVVDALCNASANCTPGDIGYGEDCKARLDAIVGQ